MSRRPAWERSGGKRQLTMYRSVRPAAVLRTAFSNIPDDVLSVEMHDFTAIPWCSSTTLSTADKPRDVPNPSEEAGPAALDVRVLLVQLPPQPSRFTPHRIQLGVGQHRGGDLTLYGGAWTEADGPSDNFASLVKAAVRLLKEQAGLDLSALPTSRWKQFLTITNKRAGEPVKTVVLLPEIWGMTEPLVLSSSECKETYTVEVEKEVEVEEEVEEPIPNDEDDEGKTDEEKAEKMDEDKPKTRKVMKKVMKKEKVPEERERTVPLYTPSLRSYESLLQLRWNKTSQLSLMLTAEAVAESMKRSAGDLINEALKENKALAERRMALKRQREEEEEEKQRKRKELQDKRAKEADEREAAMRAEWADEDEGKTDEEIQEAMGHREESLKEMRNELRAKWDEEDKAAKDAEEEERKDEEKGECATVNTKLLSAFSLFDKGLSKFGESPREEVSTAAIEDLLLASKELSPAAVKDLVKRAVGKDGADKIRYRALTDVKDLEMVEGKA